MSLCSSEILVCMFVCLFVCFVVVAVVVSLPGFTVRMILALYNKFGSASELFYILK